MREIIYSKSVASFAIVCGISVFNLLGGTAVAASKTSWKVTGELEEACSCRPACPCWFNSLPSRMTCDGAQIVIITKGHYGKIPLEGLAVAQFVQSPEHQSMFESFGKWNLVSCDCTRRHRRAADIPCLSRSLGSSLSEGYRILK
jgi:hypothetical protein